MQTIVISEQTDGWRVEHEGASDEFDGPAEAYRAGLAEVERLHGEGMRAQMLLVTGLVGGARSYEAFVRLGD